MLPSGGPVPKAEAPPRSGTRCTIADRQWPADTLRRACRSWQKMKARRYREAPRPLLANLANQREEFVHGVLFGPIDRQVGGVGARLDTLLPRQLIQAL